MLTTSFVVRRTCSNLPKIRIYTMVFVMVSIMALTIIEKSSAIQILGCSPDKPLEVEEDTPNFLITCVNIKEDFDLFWYLSWWRRKRTKNMRAVDCYSKQTCKTSVSIIDVEKTEEESVLNVTQFLRERFLLTGVTCREHNPKTGENNNYTCKINIKVPAIQMEGCGPGTPLEVEKVTTNYQVSCVNMHPGFEVYWYLSYKQRKKPKTMLVVDCIKPDTCFRNIPFVDIDSSNSVLNITGMIQRKVALTRITCKEWNPVSWEEYSYTCNISFINPPEISCNVNFFPHSGVYVGHCDVTKLHFRDRLYKCRWFQTNENNEEKTNFVEHNVTDYKYDGTHASAICTNITLQPNSETFTYEVLLLPDGIRVKANLNINEPDYW